MKKFFILSLFCILFSTQSFALECHGTEPFWGAKVSNTEIKLTDPMGTSVMPVTSMSTAIGTTEQFLKVYSDKRGPLATVITQKCNNGMSDDEFPMEIVIFKGDVTLYGCCE